MSQENKFWEQWSPGAAKGTEPPAEAGKAPEGAGAGGVEDDVLAAWLKSLPPNDPLVPTPTPPPATQASTADLVEAWPPAAPVDPFAGIQAGSAGPAAADWDLAIDLDPISGPAAPEAPPPAPAAPPFGAPPFDLGDLAGPVPAANPFAETPAAPPAPAPAPPSPFGPPPPAPEPPAEVLQAPPLKLEVRSGRRTQQLTIKGEALIGRPDTTRGIHPEVDLRTDDAVSRRHAKIFVRNGRYVLTDLNSTNGTRHNHQWLQPEVEVPLNPGDEIEVGEVTLIRVLEAPDHNA